jgi:predicted DCC family thiol-disulfide oxidoreductase YuxK
MSQPVLIYDGDCAFCKSACDWIRARSDSEAFEFLPCQSDERRQRFPTIVESECMDAMQLVLSDGTVFSGERALPHILRQLRRWHWAARIFSIPGVSLLAPVAYRLIARNRMAISTLITRKSEGGAATCDDDVCSIDPD